MLTYKIAENDKSKTMRQVLVTIETTNITDMSSITTNPVGKYPCFLSDFYMEYSINIGLIKTITDLQEKEVFDSAFIMFNNKRIELITGKIFKVFNYEYTTPDADKASITVFKNKLAAREAIEYLSNKYTGVYYKHYPNGLLSEKNYYVDGQIIHKSYLRNDLFNTIKSYVVYKDGVQETMYIYDDRENLIKRDTYSNGKLVNEHTY